MVPAQLSQTVKMTATFKDVLIDILKHHPYSEEGQFLQNAISQHKFPKNQIIFYQEDEAHYLYMAKSGIVVLNKFNDNSELIYHDFVIPNLFFPINTLYGESYYEYEAIAMTDVETWKIKKEDLLLFLEKFPKYFPNMYHDLVLVNERIEERLYFMMTATARERILSVIHSILNDYGTDDQQYRILPWPITIVELAHLSGLTRETASHTLSALKKEGAIVYDKKRLSIPL